MGSVTEELKAPDPGTTTPAESNADTVSALVNWMRAIAGVFAESAVKAVVGAAFVSSVAAGITAGAAATAASAGVGVVLALTAAYGILSGQIINVLRHERPSTLHDEQVARLRAVGHGSLGRHQKDSLRLVSLSRIRIGIPEAEDDPING